MPGRGTGPAKGREIPPGKEGHPVVGVSYYDAVAYTEWKNRRLPTEQEFRKGLPGH